MPEGLEISIAPERLSEGDAEERAAFGLFRVAAGGAFLTEGFDHYLNGYRAGPLVSGYYVAQWLAWNWWRLRWEPRSTRPDWPFSHLMTSIGEGYVWPNLTVFSDGVRTALISRPSSRPDAKPFRYLGAAPAIVPSSLWEAAVDAFVPQVLGRLDAEGLRDTNVHRLWDDVLAERSNPEISKRRRVEAMLGRDADAEEDNSLRQLLRESKSFGLEAVSEIAANLQFGDSRHPAPLTEADFRALAQQKGHPGSMKDAVTLKTTTLHRGDNIPAWKLGSEAARALREQEHFGSAVIADEKLAAMAGVKTSALTEMTSGNVQLSFALDTGLGSSKVVLRSRWATGRRFDLARVVGDRIFGGMTQINPATRSSTYRQKAQRSFAAELLSPFAAVDDMIAPDYDDEELRRDVAEHFQVSTKTVETILMNHGRIEREDSEQDFDLLVA